MDLFVCLNAQLHFTMREGDITDAAKGHIQKQVCPAGARGKPGEHR